MAWLRTIYADRNADDMSDETALAAYSTLAFSKAVRDPTGANLTDGIGCARQNVKQFLPAQTALISALTALMAGAGAVYAKLMRLVDMADNGMADRPEPAPENFDVPAQYGVVSSGRPYDSIGLRLARGVHRDDSILQLPDKGTRRVAISITPLNGIDLYKGGGVQHLKWVVGRRPAFNGYVGKHVSHLAACRWNLDLLLTANNVAPSTVAKDRALEAIAAVDAYWTQALDVKAVVDALPVGPYTKRHDVGLLYPPDYLAVKAKWPAGTEVLVDA